MIGDGQPGARFERWSVERYRRELGLPPMGGTHGAPTRGRRSARAARSLEVAETGAPASMSACRSSRGTLAEGGQSEEEIHLECAQWVFAREAQFPILRWMMHVPNGGKRARGEAGKMRAMGVRAGVSDFIHPMHSPRGRYTGLAIELKSAKGRASKEQKEFLQDATAAGWLTGIARSLDEFVVLAECWLQDRTLPFTSPTLEPKSKA